MENTDKTKKKPFNLSVVIGRIICFFVGHKLEKYITINGDYFYTGRCARCLTSYGLPHWRNSPPPPGKTLEDWKRYLQEREKKIIENKQTKF